MSLLTDRLARHEVRQHLRAGRTMDDADQALLHGRLSSFAHLRIERIYAWATATDHPLTNGVPLERWKARRARVRHAISLL